MIYLIVASVCAVFVLVLASCKAAADADRMCIEEQS